MARRDRSYAQGMQEYADEKRFLRKVRHRVFHPDYESPLVFRLGGYLLRVIVFVVVIAAILFIRNRKYFSGPVFSESVQTEMDHYLGGVDSEVPKVYWKNDVALTDYKAEGGPSAYFKAIHLERISAKAKWRDLLLNEGWYLRQVEIGNANVTFKSGTTPGERAEQSYQRASNPLLAIPNFSKTRFGEITLHAANFHWGPHWTSNGSLTKASGTLKRDIGGNWELLIHKGVFTQNWMKNLRLVPGANLKTTYRDGEVLIEGGDFLIGESGRVTVDGTVKVGEAAEFDLHVVMKTVKIEDILPEEFHQMLTGIVDVDMTVTGSPNRSDGIVTDGEMVLAEQVRIREMPILRTLSVVTPQTELRLMPLRSISRLTFGSRKGVLTIKDMQLVSGNDVAFVRGGFTYQMDTAPLEHLVVDTLNDPVAEERPDGGPELGFDGEVKIGMPWELLSREASYRDRYFTKGENDIGWLTVPLKGMLDEITTRQSLDMDQRWSEIEKQARDPFRGKRNRVQGEGEDG